VLPGLAKALSAIARAAFGDWWNGSVRRRDISIGNPTSSDRLLVSKAAIAAWVSSAVTRNVVLCQSPSAGPGQRVLRTPAARADWGSREAAKISTIQMGEFAEKSSSPCRVTVATPSRRVHLDFLW
jgi:hypothetical protein